MDYMILIYQDAAAANMPADAPISEPWMVYTKALIQAGVMVGGSRLAPSATATTLHVRDGKRHVQDGPYADTKEQLAGYYIIKAPDLDTALAAIAESANPPNGLLVDYHLDHGNGIDAIVALRAHCGDLPAILITADRSPAVREQARAEGIQILNKPIKPAALRALLAQWRMLRIAAAE